MKKILYGIKELCISAVIVMFVGLTALAINCYVISNNTAICFPIEIWIEGCSVVDFFLPLLVTVPFSSTLYMKRKNGFIDYVAIREDKKKYVICQILAGMILSLIVTFIVYFTALLLSLFAFFEGSNSNRDYIYNYVFGELQAEKPIIFGAIWCVWKGFIASLFTCFGYSLALYVDNVFVISMFPFIYVMAENLITGTLGIPEYGVMTSFVLNRLSPLVMSVWKYVVGVILYIIFTTIIIIVTKYTKGKQYDENCNY